MKLVDIAENVLRERATLSIKVANLVRLAPPECKFPISDTAIRQPDAFRSWTYRERKHFKLRRSNWLCDRIQNDNDLKTELVNHLKLGWSVYWSGQLNNAHKEAAWVQSKLGGMSRRFAHRIYMLADVLLVDAANKSNVADVVALREQARFNTARFMAQGDSFMAGHCLMSESQLARLLALLDPSSREEHLADARTASERALITASLKHDGYEREHIDFLRQEARFNYLRLAEESGALDYCTPEELKHFRESAPQIGGYLGLVECARVESSLYSRKGQMTRAKQAVIEGCWWQDHSCRPLAIHMYSFFDRMLGCCEPAKVTCLAEYHAQYCKDVKVDEYTAQWHEPFKELFRDRALWNQISAPACYVARRSNLYYLEPVM